MAINTRASTTSSGIRKLSAAENHQKRLNEISVNKEKLTHLVETCINKLKINYVKLSMLCGTVNIKRCTDIVNDIYLDATWYKKREKQYNTKRNNVRSTN